MTNQKTLVMETEPAKENRFDSTARRIRAAAEGVNVTLTEAEVEKFALVYLSLLDDMRELAKQKLGGEFKKADQAEKSRTKEPE